MSDEIELISPFLTKKYHTDYYPLVLGCEEHVSSLGVFVA